MAVSLKKCLITYTAPVLLSLTRAASAIFLITWARSSTVIQSQFLQVPIVIMLTLQPRSFSSSSLKRSLEVSLDALPYQLVSLWLCVWLDEFTYAVGHS